MVRPSVDAGDQALLNIASCIDPEESYPLVVTSGY
jgi:hypothetical protein